METPISVKYQHYHDASQHGPVWGLLNEILHVIVFVYTLFGMIEFRVKFIRMTNLVTLVSRVIIGHSWYLTFKFGIIAAALYLFNIKMDELRIAPTDYNCSMENAARILAEIPGGDHYTYYFADMIQVIGGPFKLLGYRSYLMFGFYSFSLLIMLAIFPIELIHQEIGFNFIRFVLNDTECMADMHAKRKQLTDTLTRWSRDIGSCNLTRVGTKIALDSQLTARYDRTSQEDDCEDRVPLKYPLSLLPRERRLWAFPPIKSQSSAHHYYGRDNNVRVACKNLEMFKPFTRSENWFKLSMIIYPMFICYYFCMLTIVVGGIQLYIIGAIKDLSVTCSQDLFANWTWLDRATFYETLYMIFAMSCSISFYTSYYFGTVLELYVWLAELNQQMDICRNIQQLESLRKRDIALVPSGFRKPIEYFLFTDRHGQCPSIRMLLDELKIKDVDISPCYNQYGGLDCIVAHLRSKFHSQSRKLKQLQIIALRLITKKQTVYRATYINANLFMAELSDTRHMTTTILKRTTYIAVTLATMAASTTSQFQLNYINLTALFGACLAILNLYLVCAALIVNQVKHLVHQIHKFVGTMTDGTSDQDITEIWVKFIDTFGKDQSKLGYKMFCYDITWGSILGFNGLVSSAYLYTIY